MLMFRLIDFYLDIMIIIINIINIIDFTGAQSGWSKKGSSKP